MASWSALLDQQPELASATIDAGAGQRVAAAQLVAVQLDDQVAVAERAFHRYLATVALRAIAMVPVSQTITVPAP